MMKMSNKTTTYKRLGDYIRLVDVRNKDLKIKELLGINIDKFFMPSVANVIGTNLRKYKIVKKYQFACNRMHVGRDYRIPIALSQKDEPFIVSPAYDVFEIIDTDKLNPEYLMMWFSRKEFDRNAWFYTDADVRGGMSWQAFLDMQLPVPPIERQNEIVAEYNTVVNRIKLNEQLNQKLEETAQTIFKHWFVDFEFPNEQGKPYKSSGGKMVWNEELEKEIPDGWRVGKFGEIVENTYGGDWGKSKISGNYNNKVLCVRGTDIHQFRDGNVNNIPIRYILQKNLTYKKIKENQIIIEISGGSPTQSTGRTVLISKNHLQLGYPIICSNFCKVITLKNELYSKYIYYFINHLYNLRYLFTYENSTTGVKNFNIESFLNEQDMLLPNKNEIVKFNKLIDAKINNNFIIRQEINKLQELQNVLLSKMAKD